ncbi:MAG: hypothetical protein IPJ43_17485 [Saprospiraceae bacterium]|nr:hypothetical protein [Saprospiraceae bacterium]
MDHLPIAECDQELYSIQSDYEPTQAARVIEKFVTDDLSNWHVRLSRRRF